MSLGTFIRGILRKGTSSNEDPGNTKPSKASLDGREDTSSQDAPYRPIAISENDAKALLGRYKPLIDELNRRSVDYCIVGGLGVMIQSLDKLTGKVRFTEDVDIMVDMTFSNQSFLEAYLEAFAENAEQAEALAHFANGGVFVDDGCTASDFENLSVKALSRERYNVEIPGVDVARKLNGLTLADLGSECINIDGTVYRVATVDTLREMKSRTVSMLKASIMDTSRPRDFLDLRKLELIKEGAATWHR